MPELERFRVTRRCPPAGGVAFAAAVLLAAPPARVDGQTARPRPAPIVVDHRAIADFDRIPDAFVAAAARLSFLLRSASIGANIDQGLSCLMNEFPGRRRRPNFCDRGVPRGEVVYGARYDRSRWTFEIRGNPGWWDKVRDFVTRVDRIAPAERIDVVAFNFNYGDGLPGSAIADQFFAEDPDERLRNVLGVEGVEQAHPDKTVVWWTMALPRRSSKEMQTFNARLRDYARARGKVLFDLADIESHRPDGSPCVDSRGQGLDAVCQDYTAERVAGHLNGLGIQRVAKALWVLMARLAGWDG
jgi:hypothetical protein